MSAIGTLAVRYWYLLVIAALVAAVVITRSTLADTKLTLTNERAAWTFSLGQADKLRMEQEAGHAVAIAGATQDYADRLAAREPIIIRSANTVREYAQTDAGRVLCRDADRVRAIDALDAELASAPHTATRGNGALPADASTPPGRR